MTEGTPDLVAIKARSVKAMGNREPMAGEPCWALDEALAIWRSARDVRPLLFEVLRLQAGLQEIASGKHLSACPRVNTTFGYLMDDVPCDCHEQIAHDLLHPERDEGVSPDG
jgi:hypothetical protein